MNLTDKAEKFSKNEEKTNSLAIFLEPFAVKIDRKGQTQRHKRQIPDDVINRRKVFRRIIEP